MKRYTHARTHTHTYARKHTQTYTYMQTKTHTQKHTHTHKYKPIHTHIRARAHTHPHKHTHTVLSRSEARVCGTTYRTMSRRLDPSSCLSRYLKRSYLVNLSKCRLFLSFVRVPSTLFDLFVVKMVLNIQNHRTTLLSLHAHNVWNAVRCSKLPV